MRNTAFIFRKRSELRDSLIIHISVDTNISKSTKIALGLLGTEPTYCRCAGL
jgi:hypothetical protein